MGSFCKLPTVFLLFRSSGPVFVLCNSVFISFSLYFLNAWFFFKFINFRKFINFFHSNSWTFFLNMTFSIRELFSNSLTTFQNFWSFFVKFVNLFKQNWFFIKFWYFYKKFTNIFIYSLNYLDQFFYSFSNSQTFFQFFLTFLKFINIFQFFVNFSPQIRELFFESTNSFFKIHELFRVCKLFAKSQVKGQHILSMAA